ncbi:TetR/AcrR family transcriptional regulator C-terminal domain-containing protein [Herbidospora yilanensis]|uniref:TetR/AcrR family transcriptional regulator C-terminal domain-containing protein n=1 Tax=Herbidospora yilanensis TaxID=354426 RepID=UPI00078277C0|nr:TetR/AcrR family transcriptional regulator C-terminal domain-containing protein [Herbidospora yilanensis]
MPEQRFTSVWTREHKPRREQQGLSRDQIVRATVELLDAEGMEALSMRKLGARLGAGATSLYWHVANKNELLELAMDEVFGEVRLPASESWRETTSNIAWGLRAAIMAHPWFTFVLGSLPALGPNALNCSAMLCAALSRAGFTGTDIDYAGAAVLSYTIGATAPEAAYTSALKSRGLTMEQANRDLAPAVERATRAHPEIHARFQESAGSTVDPIAHRQLSFDFGLIAVLDGLAARLSRSADMSPNHLTN